MQKEIIVPLFQIINEISEEKDRRRKILLLKKHESPELKQFLGYVYDPRVQFKELKRLPDYQKHEARKGENETALGPIENAAWERLKKPVSKGSFPYVYYLTDHGKGNLTVEQRLSKYKSMLETVHPKDAELFENMFYKVPITGITRKIIEEAFPKLTKDWPVE